VATMPGRLIYKCRLCGGTDESTGVPSVLNALIHIQLDGDTRKAWPQSAQVAHATDIHNCPDGRLGISDLQGGHERDP
jgi:hypothetical protein